MSIFCRRLGFLIFSALSVSNLALSKTIESQKFSKADRNKLTEKFSDIGVPKSYVKKVFLDKRVVKYPNVLPKNINNKQAKRNYSSFYDSYSQHLTKKFMKKWRSRFLKAEKKYQVDKEAIAAIMLVETGLGSIRGRYHVLSVFSSIVIEASKELVKDQIASAKLKARYKKKLKWATGEIKSMLSQGHAKKLNILPLKGSSSGAFGLSQFLPSSYERWAVDGDNSGTINLHYPADAIASIANYLKVQGWVKGLKNVENRAAVFHYNNSNIYVDTILQVAAKLQTAKIGKKTSKKRQKSAWKAKKKTNRVY